MRKLAKSVYYSESRNLPCRSLMAGRLAGRRVQASEISLLLRIPLSQVSSRAAGGGEECRVLCREALHERPAIARVRAYAAGSL